MKSSLETLYALFPHKSWPALPKGCLDGNLLIRGPPKIIWHPKAAQGLLWNVILTMFL